MRVGIVIQETWSFFNEIFEEVKNNHEATLFERRTVKLPIYENRFNDYLLHRDFVQFLKENDVVFFEWASELLAYASHLPKISRIVARLHRYEMYMWADQINWGVVDKVILVSQAKKKEFIQRFPEHVQKIIVIPEAVSLSRFHSRIKPFNGNIGILCHLTPRKRVYELILAFYELVQLNPNFTLHIGGGRHSRFGDYYEALHRLVSELGLTGKVIFYGNVESPEEWYTKIDIFISNSYSEGLQLSPMEAIASGCYCLSHCWDGAAEIFPPECLYLTERELIERLNHYSNTSDTVKQAAIEKLQSIVRERFDMDQIKVRVRQVIEEVGSSAAN